MTKEEILNYFKDINFMYNNPSMFDTLKCMLDELNEPCEDAVSRQAVNDLVDELARAISDERCCISRGRSTATIMQDILDLPSVTPKSMECEDAVSRDSALKALCYACSIHQNGGKCSRCDGYNAISDLPPVILKPTKCEDAVSREAVLEYIEGSEAELGHSSENELVCQDIKDLPSVTPKQRWIPVSERLPEKNVEVLATTEWGAVTIAEMYSANDWFIHEGTTNAEIDEIVAWMPLPEPYKEGESE